MKILAAVILCGLLGIGGTTGKLKICSIKKNVSSKNLFHRKNNFPYINFVISRQTKEIGSVKVIIVYYVPRRIMRVVTRRARMLAGDRSRGAISSASI